MLFDTHTHYDDPQFDPDRDELLAALPENSVGCVVDPGCDLPSSRMAVELANRFAHVYAAVGIHPENCADYDPAMLDELRTLVKENKKVVAIGEIGLDYHWEDENTPREKQQRVLRDQLALARELDLPVIIHDRDAHGDIMTIVREFPAVRGVFHCYGGSVEDAKELVKRGWMLGFNGVITFKNARKAPEVIKMLPHDRILLETDSPYLAPVPLRGKRNDSRNVRLVCEKVAEFLELPAEEVERFTWENAKRFYGV